MSDAVKVLGELAPKAKAVVEYGNQDAFRRFVAHLLSRLHKECEIATTAEEEVARLRAELDAARDEMRIFRDRSRSVSELRVRLIERLAKEWRQFRSERDALRAELDAVRAGREEAISFPVGSQVVIKSTVPEYHLRGKKGTVTRIGDGPLRNRCVDVGAPLGEQWFRVDDLALKPADAGGERMLPPDVESPR